MAALHHAFRLVKHHVGDFDVAFRRLIKRGGNHLGVHTALHVGDLFGAFVNKQDDEVYFGVIVGDGVCYILQQYGFTRFRLSHNQSALTLSDGSEEVDDAGGELAAGMSGDVDFLIREHWGEVVEWDTVADFFRQAAVNLVDFGQREVFLAGFRGTDGAIDGVSILETEEFDL